MMLKNTFGKVKVQEEVSRGFRVMQGVRQGDVLSTFDVLLKAIRNIKVNKNGTILN